MFGHCSNNAGLRLGSKRRHGKLFGQGCSKELRTLIERTNDQYEVREEEFVRVLWRDHYGLYHNLTISAAHSLSDEMIVALAIKEYGVPSVESVLMLQHVKHQFLVLSELRIERADAPFKHSNL